MARDPGSVWAPLPEAGAPDGLRKTQFIVHSTGGQGTARGVRDNWFARDDVLVESTFIVGKTAADPTLQLMDSTDRADANGQANGRGISVEVIGTGDEPFTDWQLDELVRLGSWARDEHGIPRQVIGREPEPGYGWHVMFGAPGPWTSARGKVCPGGIRIQQLKTTVFPRIFAVPTQEDPLSALSPAQVTQLVKDARQAAELTEQLVTIFRNGDDKLPHGRAYGALVTARDAAVAAAKGNPKALADAIRPYLIDAVKAGQAAGPGATAGQVVDELVARLAKPKG